MNPTLFHMISGDNSLSPSDSLPDNITIHTAPATDLSPILICMSQLYSYILAMVN